MKTNTQHTPGPWKSEICRQYGENFDTVLIRANGENADALNEDNMTVAILTGCRNTEANARLIAAAPALLAALDNLQANPNDPRAHRQALDALKLARPELPPVINSNAEPA